MYLHSAIFLPVGTNIGEIGLWDVGTKERLVSRCFKVFDMSSLSMNLQVF